MNKILPNQEIDPRFATEIYRRIEVYFNKNQLTKKMDGEMRWKIFFAFFWWGGSYALLYVGEWTGWQFFLLYLFHGLSQVLLALGIAHDANHSALSSKPGVNKLFSYAFDICGVSSYLWRIMHHTGHHHCVNVHGRDTALTTGGVLRMAPNEPWKKIHRFQHIYVFILYALYTLDYVFARDFRYLFSKKIPNMQGRIHPPGEIVIVVASKLFYIGYMIVVPGVLLDFPVLAIAGCFVVTHLVMGLIMLLTFQTSHIVLNTFYPATKKDFSNYLIHVLATTSDYGLKNRIFTWYVGGLNLHVIHHLAAGICHTHYPALTRIIRSTAAEFEVPYLQHPTLIQALASHIRHLKQLGRP